MPFKCRFVLPPLISSSFPSLDFDAGAEQHYQELPSTKSASRLDGAECKKGTLLT